MARIYDLHLHNRLQSLKYYEEAIKLEASGENTEFAKTRIEEINMSMQETN